jgi:hypothetical protein
MRRQAFCALISLAFLNCAVLMATYGSAPRPADDVAAYAKRLIDEAALGEINTCAGVPPQLFLTDDLTCDITDVPWSANYTSTKGGFNGTVLTALMPLRVLYSFRDGEQDRAGGDRFPCTGVTKTRNGAMKYASFGCGCGVAKPPGKKEKEAATARALKREAAVLAQPAAPQETAAAAPLSQEGGAAAALEQGGANEVERSGAQDLAPPPPAAARHAVKLPAAEAKKNGERGVGAAPTKKIGCPVRFTASLREETLDGEPVYLVTYLEWEHADGCKVLAPRMTSDACKARLVGYFQSRPGLRAWEAVRMNCTHLATEYAKLHPEVTDIAELQERWQQVRYMR